MKKISIDTSEIDKHVQALKDLYTCIMILQDLLDEFNDLDYLYNILTDYLLVVDRTARFLSKIDEAINND